MATSWCGSVAGRSGAATATGRSLKVLRDVTGLNDSAKGAASSVAAAAPIRTLKGAMLNLR